MTVRGLQTSVVVAALLVVAAIAGALLFENDGTTPPAANPGLDARPTPSINSGRRVEVLNAAGTPGLARTATDYLRSAGFDVVHLGNADERDPTSVVIDRVGKPQLARAVAAALGIPHTETRVDSSRLVEVTVILGTDWRH
jgi:hypothetical protein